LRVACCVLIIRIRLHVGFLLHFAVVYVLFVTLRLVKFVVFSLMFVVGIRWFYVAEQFAFAFSSVHLDVD